MAKILLKRGDGDWREPDVQSIATEAELQDLLLASPQLIPGVSDVPTAAVKEFAVESGYVDVVAVGADGAVTLVECKLGANPEIRRHVVGQVLAYAASMWRLSYDEFESAFQTRWGGVLADAHDVFGGDWSFTDFQRRVTDVLATGSFRIVIAVDHITDELERTVLYLNQHTAAGVEVLALEAGLVRDGDLQILIPKVYGEESAKAKQTSRTRAWTRDDFVKHAEDVSSPVNHEVIKRLVAWADANHARPYWGEGKHHPSLTAWVHVDGVESPSWSCFLSDTDGTTVNPNFEWLATRLTEESLSRLARALRRIPEFSDALHDLEEREYRRRPSVRIGVFADEDKLSTFLEAFDELIATGVAKSSD